MESTGRERPKELQKDEAPQCPERSCNQCHLLPIDATGCGFHAYEHKRFGHFASTLSLTMPTDYVHLSMVMHDPTPTSLRHPSPRMRLRHGRTTTGTPRRVYMARQPSAYELNCDTWLVNSDYAINFEQTVLIMRQTCLWSILDYRGLDLLVKNGAPKTWESSKRTLLSTHNDHILGK